MLNTKEGFEIARDDFLFEREEIRLIGDPYWDEEDEEWVQEAEDDKGNFLLVLNSDGNIDIVE